MEELYIEKNRGLMKIHGIQSLLTISFACFSVSATIIFVMSLLAVTTTDLDEVWLIVLETSFIIAGVLLLIATIIVIVKEPIRKIISILLVVIAVISAAIPMILLQMNFTNFKDHFPLAEIYPHFKDYMWKQTSYLLAISILIIIGFVFLIIIKIGQKEVKKNIPLLITSALSLLLILPLQIIGLVVSKFANKYEIGLKIFWGATIGFAVISLLIFYYIVKEIEAVSVDKIVNINQNQNDNIKTSNRTTDSLLESNSRIMIIFGAICIIASMIWLVLQGNNQDLVYYQFKNLPDSAFLQFALYGFGTTIIAYNLLKWLKVKKQQVITTIIATIGIAIIIPVKILSIYLVWKWGAENVIYTSFGWTSKVKPFVIVLTDLIPIAISLLFICVAKWRMKSNKMKNIWLLIIPTITMLATIIFLSIVIWRLWGDPTFDIYNFYGLFVVSIILSVVEIIFLIAIMIIEMTAKKEDIGKIVRTES